MADPKGSDPKPNDGKPTEERSGPVKPPVLDLKARDTAGETKKPADAQPKPTPEESVANKSAAPRTQADQAGRKADEAEKTAGGFAFGAAIAGGVLGLAGAYGLAWAGLWPAPPAPAADPRLEQYGSALAELETETAATQSELIAFTERLGALEEAPAPEPADPVDLQPVQAEIAELRERVQVIAEASPEGTDPSALEPLRADLQSVIGRIDEVAARLGTVEAELRTVDAAVGEVTATLAEQPDDLGAVLQLPLILSGLENAFATGRPYLVELAALRAALPELDVPPPLTNVADTGLPRPEVVVRRFNEVLPSMLAGRPAEPGAEWREGALDWLSSAIALRPTGEVEGDAPTAIVSRLEAAIERRDFIAAEELLEALPAPMLAAANNVPVLIASQAEAHRFLETVRTQVIAGEVLP